MTAIHSALIEFFTSHQQSPIVVAYSGGVDSQVLLHSLVQLKQNGQLNNEIVACHVNHGLSPNAEYWQSFAVKQCAQLNIKLIQCQVTVDNKNRVSLEEAARDARYEALLSATPVGGLLVTGHHQDDQAETLLLALKRGSGLKGLSGMSINQPLGHCSLVRPLLTVTRNDIEQCAKQLKLEWIEDESNTNVAFDRNFIRHQILPSITERWSSALATMSRSVSHCQDAQLLIDELAGQDLSHVTDDNGTLLVEPLAKLSQLRFNNLIRYYLAQQDLLMPTQAQLNQLYCQFNCANDKTPEIKLGNYWIRRYKQKLFLTPRYVDVTPWSTTINNTETTLANAKSLYNAHIELPDLIGTIDVEEIIAPPHNVTAKNTVEHSYVIKAPTPQQQLSIRFSHNNPTCLPDYRQHSRPLKKIFQECYIPPWLRQRTPLIYFNDSLVAALGVFTEQAYLAKAGEKAIRLSWCPHKESGYT